MQKRDSSGSILIWSLFFSAFIAFLFISISTSINKNIKDSSSLSESIDRELLSESLEKNPSEPLWSLDKNEKIKKVKSFYALQKDEIHEFRFVSKTNISNNINILKGWPLQYVFVSSSWTTIPSVTSSWIILNGSVNFTWIFTFPNRFNWSLFVKNIWWYAEYSLTSSGTFIPEKEIYIRTKNYGGYEVEKWVYEINNFIKWDFWIDYNQFWIEF